MRKLGLQALTCALVLGSVLGSVSVAYASSPPPPTDTPPPTTTTPPPTTANPEPLPPARMPPAPEVDPPLPLPSPKTVTGKTPGQFSVTPAGASSYRVPIAVPPGIAGMQPNLALVYNSQNSNGLFGVGWNLSGMSAITRCPRIKASDNIPVPVNVRLDKDDRFCLDGQRLVLVGTGTYGAPGTEYRTEIDSFAKVTAVGAAGSGPASFIVKTKSGLTLEYGNSTNSKIEAVQAANAPVSWAAGTVRVWANNKTTDAAGNFMTTSYIEDAVSGEYYPERMDYAGNAVQFVATARPDVSTYYQAGAVIKASARIGNVKTFVGVTPATVLSGATPVNDYQLAYEQSTTTQRSRVKSIAKCNGIAVCFAPVSLTWQDSTAGFDTAVSWSSTGTNFADVSGDGLLDHVVTWPAFPRVYVSTNNGSGLNAQAIWFGWSPLQSPCTDVPCETDFVDMHGTGMLNHVRTRRDTNDMIVSELVPNGMGALWNGAVTGAPYGAYSSRYLDMNGDGLTDHVRTLPSSGHVLVGINQLGVGGSGFGGFGSNNATTWNAAGKTDNAAGTSWSDYKEDFVDVNGDGLPDYVRTLSKTGHVLVYLNNGTGGFGAATVWKAADASDTSYTTDFVDVNGDGLPDYVRTVPDTNQVWVFLNNGVGFNTAKVEWKPATAGGWSTYATELRDVNGDGLPDYVRLNADNNHVMVSVNNGNGFNAAVQWNAATAGGWSSYRNQLLDINGDGLPDYVRPRLDISSVQISFNKGTKSDVVKTIAYGINASDTAFTITYQPLTNKAVYTKDRNVSLDPSLELTYMASAYPLMDIQAPLYVVSQVDSINGIGGVNSSTYKYGGLKAEQGTGHGMLGFRWMKSRDVRTGIENYTEFRQDFPYTGLVSKTEIRLSGKGNAGVLKRSTNTLACKIPLDASACVIQPRCDNTSNGPACAAASAARYVPVVTSNLQESWELYGAALPTVTTTTIYVADSADAKFYGDVGQVQTAIDGVVTQVVDTVYNPADTANWILGQRKQVKIDSVTP